MLARLKYKGRTDEHAEDIAMRDIVKWRCFNYVDVIISISQQRLIVKELVKNS
jgi:hypothetical protein